MPIVTKQIPPPAAGESAPVEIRKTVSMRSVFAGWMRRDVSRRLGFYGTLCGLIVSALIFCGSPRPVFAADPKPAGYPWDWSHEHLVFSNTDDPVMRAMIKKDPRAFHQWLRRKATVSRTPADGAPISFDTFLPDGTFGKPSAEPAPEARSASRRVEHKRVEHKNDWGVSLGATNFGLVNATNAAPLYPAKYTFDLNATPNCYGMNTPPDIGDYVAFPTGALGATNTSVTMTPNGQASIAIYNNLYSAQPTGGYCGTDGPTVFAAYINALCPATTSSDPISSSPVLSLDGTKIAWVTSTGKVQILTYGLGFSTSGGSQSVLAPACIGPVMSGSLGDGATLQTVTLANAKGTPTVSLSAIFVDYHSDAAYVGDDDGFLHKISPFFTATGTLHEMTTPGWQPMTSYGLGAVIVDTNGYIEQVTAAGKSGSSQPSWSKGWGNTVIRDGGVHGVNWQNLGSGGGWPIYVTGSSGDTDISKLNGPIFDFTSKNVFVGDQNGSLYYVMDPPSSTVVGSCATFVTLYPCLGLPLTTSPITPATGDQSDCAANGSGFNTCLVMSNAQGFTDSVIVDSANSLVITQFSDADGTNATVEQTNTSLGVFNSVALSAHANPSLAYHTGAFDNAYYSNPLSGNFYVCAPDPSSVQTDLYRISFTSTAGAVALGSVNGSPITLTSTATSGNCSPLTEIYNTFESPVHDWLFLSLDNNGKTAGCAGGSCVISFNLLAFGNPDHSYGSGSTPHPGIAGMNGTGGIIVDNNVPVIQTPSRTVAAASESGTTATITTSTQLTVYLGQSISVSGMADAGYDTAGATITCIGALCAAGATADSISYTASSGLSSCSGTAMCAGKALGIGYNNASSIYFTPVANNLTCGDGTTGTGCAVKLTQALLH